MQRRVPLVLHHKAEVWKCICDSNENIETPEMPSASGWCPTWPQRLRSGSSLLRPSWRGQKGYNRRGPRYSERWPLPETALASNPRCVPAHKLHPTSQLKPKAERSPSQAEKPDGKKSYISSSWARQLFSSERRRVRHRPPLSAFNFLLPDLRTAFTLRDKGSETINETKDQRGLTEC